MGVERKKLSYKSKQSFRKGLSKGEFLKAVKVKAVGMSAEKAYEVYKDLFKEKKEPVKEVKKEAENVIGTDKKA